MQTSDTLQSIYNSVYLNKIPFYKLLTKQEQALFSASIFEISLETGKFLVESGHMCQNIYFVMEGLIRVYKITPDGKEITLYRIGSGEVCLFTVGCVMEHEPFDAVAQTEQPSKLIAMPADVFERIMGQNRAFQNYMFKKLLTAMTELMTLTEEVTFHSVNRRIAAFLLQHQNDSALSMTHEAIAFELGTAREVVSRMLKSFEKSGLIQLSRGQIQLLDIESLKNISEM